LLILLALPKGYLSLSYLFRLSRTAVTQVVEQLDEILAFNNLLVSLKNHPNADHFARGIGPISLFGEEPLNLGLLAMKCVFMEVLNYYFSSSTSGGEYDTDRKMDDLKILYRAYVAESFSSGRLEESKVWDFFY